MSLVYWVSGLSIACFASLSVLPALFFCVHLFYILFVVCHCLSVSVCVCVCQFPSYHCIVAWNKLLVLLLFCFNLAAMQLRHSVCACAFEIPIPKPQYSTVRVEVDVTPLCSAILWARTFILPAACHTWVGTFTNLNSISVAPRAHSARPRHIPSSDLFGFYLYMDFVCYKKKRWSKMNLKLFFSVSCCKVWAICYISFYISHIWSDPFSNCQFYQKY